MAERLKWKSTDVLLRQIFQRGDLHKSIWKLKGGFSSRGLIRALAGRGIKLYFCFDFKITENNGHVNSFIVSFQFDANRNFLGNNLE